MGEDFDNIKKGLKNLTKNAEKSIAKSIIRWKFNKEGKAPPDDTQLEAISKKITDDANEIIFRKSKDIWHSVKTSYKAPENKGDNNKEWILMLKKGLET